MLAKVKRKINNQAGITRINTDFVIFSLFQLQFFLKTDDFITILSSLKEIEILGGFLHQSCRFCNTLLKLRSCHPFHNGIGSHHASRRGVRLYAGGTLQFFNIGPVVLFQGTEGKVLDNLFRCDMMLLIVVSRRLSIA